MRFKSLKQVFACGLTVSFLGSIPLGPLNLIVTYLSVSKGSGAACAFSLGCIVTELVFVSILLPSLLWVQTRQRFFKILEWTTITVIIMAVYSFMAAIKQTGFSSALPASINYPFLSGVVISALDPMKIPFWFLWSTWLISNGVLRLNRVSSFQYLAGIGLGSLLGFFIFIFGGNYLVKAFKLNQDIVNWAIGSILALTAFIQIYRSMQKKVDASPVNSI